VTAECLKVRYTAIVSESTRVGKRGTIVLPAKLRRRYGFEEGTMIVAEESPYGVLLRPAAVVPLEIYTPERKAEFLLSNATDAGDYKRAQAAVREMGLKPSKIRHKKPGPR
jgi:bifunctional DNA-binding transcriptional regulator/antitoxin component of YhaV-PrlF toxin-antitoxin module